MLRFRNVNVYFKPDLPNIWVELKPVNEVEVEEGQFRNVVSSLGRRMNCQEKSLLLLKLISNINYDDLYVGLHGERFFVVFFLYFRMPSLQVLISVFPVFNSY